MVLDKVHRAYRKAAKRQADAAAKLRLEIEAVKLAEKVRATAIKVLLTPSSPDPKRATTLLSHINLLLKHTKKQGATS